MDQSKIKTQNKLFRFASVTSELREEWALEEEAANSGGGVVDPIPGGGVPTNGQTKNNLQQKGY